MEQLQRTMRPGYKWLIPLIILAVLAAGFSGLVYQSTYFPLIFLVGICACYVGLAWLKKPVWALYAALFVALLPIGVISENIHSILNRSLAVIAIAVWCFDVTFTRRKIFLTPSAIFMLIFLAWGILTLFWAEIFSAATTRLQVYVLRFLLFLFLIPNEIKTQKHLNGLLNTLSFSGWVLVTVSIFILLNQGYIPGSRFKLFDTNENSIGMLALLAMPSVLLQSSASSKYKALKTSMAFIFMLLTIGLVAISGSRGSYISLVIILAAFCFWKPSRKWGKLGFAILVLGITVAPFVFETTIERFVQMSGGSALGGREIIWQAAWQIISRHPLGGVGIGNAPYSIVPYLTLLDSAVGKESVSLHNPLLVIWSETGLLGICLYLAVLISAVLSFIKQCLKDREREEHLLVPYFAFVSSSFLGYMASWIKGGGMEADFTYFLLLAMLLIPAGLNRETESDKSGIESSISSQPHNKYSL